MTSPHVGEGANLKWYLQAASGPQCHMQHREDFQTTLRSLCLNMILEDEWES